MSDIHNLLGKYFSGEISPQEQEAVQQWVNESEENRSEFNLLEQLWKGAGEQPAINFSTEKAWQNVDAKIKSSAGNSKGVISMFSKVVIGIAAMLILALGIWWIAGSNNNDMQQLVATADVQQILLEDGTKVFLKKGSSLEYPENFSGGERSVSLKGEAFFYVAHNPQKPFIIDAAETEIKVLGTSFSVNTNNSKVELIVKTGRVSFSSKNKNGEALIVSAGERALFENNTFAKQENKDVNFNAWQSKQIIFTNTSLQQVAETLSSYYNVQLEINKEDSANIAETAVTASFDDEPLDAVLNELSLITSYHIKKLSNNHYKIYSKK